MKGGTFLVREKRVLESSRMIDSWSVENDTKGLLMGLMSRHPASGCLSRPLEITGREKREKGGVIVDAILILLAAMLARLVTHV